jgi:hypothetical protein
MPVGVIIIGIIIVVLLLLYGIYRINPSTLSNIEFAGCIIFVVLVSVAIVYIIALSFFDNETAIRLLKDFLSIF